MGIHLVFEWVLRLSVMAGILVVFLLLFKFIIKDKLGPKWHYYIWFLVLLRLLVPAAPQSAISVYNLFINNEQEAAPIIVSVDNTQDSRTGFVGEQGETTNNIPEEGITFSENESVQDNFAPIQSQGSPAPGINTSGILPYIWLVGLLIIALYTTAVNLLFWLKIKNQESISDQGILRLFDECKSEMGLSRNIPLIETDKVNTTTLFGFIKPKLLLPLDITKKLTPQELRYIFFHELAHIKQKDIMINWWIALAQIIHWFNPLIWYAFYRMRQDREVACDALALSCLKPEDYKKYGQVIIRLLERFAEQKQVPGMIGVAGDNSNIKKRVTMISLFKKNSYKMSAAAAAVMILFILVFLTNASGSPIVDDPGLEKEESEDEVLVKQEEVRGNTTGNIANGGLVAYQDGWIYYSNREDEGRLYKKRTDGSDINRLSSNAARDINVIGDWVYYSNSFYYYPNEGGNIFKIKTDGSDETRLNDHSSTYVQVVDDWIYYTHFDPEKQTNAPYKMRKDGSEQTMIIDRTVYNLNVVDGWLYFIESEVFNVWHKIFKVRIDGSDLTLLYEGWASNLIVEGEWMYYNQGDSLVRSKTDGSSRQMVSFEPTHEFWDLNVDGEWIYYVSEGWWNIYRMRNDGSDLERINNERSSNIFTAGDWIYYLSANNFRKISKDIPGQTGLRYREDVSSLDVKEELWRRAISVLGEASRRGAGDGPPSYEGPEDSGISWVIYNKYTGYAEITYKMSPKSNEMDQLLEQLVEEFSALFAELAEVHNINYFIDNLYLQVIVYDNNGVWRNGIYLHVDGETLINADWSSPSVKIHDNFDQFETFSSWWIYNDEGGLSIHVQEENGTAMYVVPYPDTE